MLFLVSLLIFLSLSLSLSPLQANTHVFPGGILDESDCSTAWLDVFAATRDCFSSLCMKNPLPIYSDIPPNAGAVLGAVLTSTFYTSSFKKNTSFYVVLVFPPVFT